MNLVSDPVLAVSCISLVCLVLMLFASVIGKEKCCTRKKLKPVPVAVPEQTQPEEKQSPTEEDASDDTIYTVCDWLKPLPPKDVCHGSPICFERSYQNDNRATVTRLSDRKKKVCGKFQCPLSPIIELVDEGTSGRQACFLPTLIASPSDSSTLHPPRRKKAQPKKSSEPGCNYVSGSRESEVKLQLRIRDNGPQIDFQPTRVALPNDPSTMHPSQTTSRSKSQDEDVQSKISFEPGHDYDSGVEDPSRCTPRKNAPESSILEQGLSLSKSISPSNYSGPYEIFVVGQGPVTDEGYCNRISINSSIPYETIPSHSFRTSTNSYDTFYSYDHEISSGSDAGSWLDVAPDEASRDPNYIGLPHHETVRWGSYQSLASPKYQTVATSNPLIFEHGKQSYEEAVPVRPTSFSSYDHEISPASDAGSRLYIPSGGASRDPNNTVPPSHVPLMTGSYQSLTNDSLSIEIIKQSHVKAERPTSVQICF